MMNGTVNHSAIMDEAALLRTQIYGMGQEQLASRQHHHHLG